MNIETIIRENYYECVIAAFAAVALVYACVHSLWRWVAGRRKKRTEPLRLREWQPSRAQREMYEHLRRTAFGAEPKPAPDRQYQGDQVTGLRKEVQELEARVEKLEGKDVQQELLKPLIDRMRQRMCAPDYHGTPDGEPAPAPEYRVFRSPSEHVFHVLRDGHEICHKYWGMWMGHPQGDPWVCGQFTDHGFTELHGPVKDAIVAEFQVWRAGQ